MEKAEETEGGDGREDRRMVGRENGKKTGEAVSTERGRTVRGQGGERRTRGKRMMKTATMQHHPPARGYLLCTGEIVL